MISNDVAHHSPEDRVYTNPAKTPVVLQVLPALHTGGVERGTVDVAVCLAKAGWGSVVVSSGGPMVYEMERAGAKHITLPVHSKNPITIARNVERLREVIRTHGVSLVHARSRAPAWSAYRAARKCCVPFVTTFHGTYSVGPLGLKKHYNRIMVMGDRVIAVSRFIADHITSTYGVDQSNLRIIHRGVDTDLFSPQAVGQDRLIDMLRCWQVEDRPIIMLPGRLTSWKGQKVLIEAISKLQNKDAIAVFVGSDQGRTDYSEDLIKLAETLGVSDRIYFAPVNDDMPAAYKLASIVVSASTRPEAFGRVVAEALSMERPVIAPNHGAAVEIITEGETGWLVPPGDCATLAKVLDQVLCLDESTLEGYAVRGRRHVEESFSKRSMLAKTMEVYKELISLPEASRTTKR